MIKNIWVLIITVMISTISSAQDKFPAFGEIGATDIQLSSCSFEPSANAMKLFDLLETEYEHSPFGGKIHSQRRVRIKIFNEKGFSSATITIPYYSNRKNTKIEELKGVVYNTDPSGKVSIQNIPEEDFYKDKLMDKIGMLRFTFPNLRAGSVIEYTYTMTERNRVTIDNWMIQSDLPTAYASAAVIIPTFSRVKEVVFGSDSVERRIEQLTKGLDKEKKIFFKRNIPSFEPEPHMSSYKDNVLRMGFMLFPEHAEFADDISAASTWKLAASMMLRSTFFDEQFRKVIGGTEKIVDTAKSIPSIDDRVHYLYNTLKKRIPVTTGQTAAPEEIDNSWKTRTASSSQVNMILMNLLRRSGVTCHPLLVSTQGNGMIKTDFPNFGQFNGLDVFVSNNGNYYIMDASIKFQPYNLPPFNIINRQAFLLDPDNIQWINISDDRPFLKRQTDLFALVTAEGKIEGSATLKYYDYAKALALDSSTWDDDNSDQKFFNKKKEGLTLISSKQENVNNDDPLLQTIEFDYEPQQSGNFYFINPQLLTSGKMNPFKKDKRVTDIDFGCNQEHHLTLQIEIPASFEIDHLPKNIILRSPDSSFAFTRIVSADRSNISYSHSLEIKKAIFSKDQYAGLYDFFSQVDGMLSEEIVLKKK